MQFLIHITIDEFKALIKDTITEVIANSPQSNSHHPQELVKEFMNVKEAAIFLSLAVNTLYEKTSERTIPHFKRGSRLMFKRSELIKWLEEGKVSTAAEVLLQYNSRRSTR
jgi:excisionase family DNA binding protein